ncbi:MAG: hypothetical protein PVI26_05655 [Chitinispirillia bacterium]|jgi:hypothetical protein
MPWIRKYGIEGLVFVPDKHRAGNKKHDCEDCFHCQMCSESRCYSCQNVKQTCIKEYIPKKNSNKVRSKKTYD